MGIDAWSPHLQPGFSELGTFRTAHFDFLALWARFGEATLTAPHAVQWLSDNGPLGTRRLLRDCLGDADLGDAETVLARLGGWIEDYNRQAPHSALGMRSPTEYRAALTLSSSGVQ